MAKFKNLKIMILLAMAFTVGACGGGSGSTETVTGLSTADNTQLLTE